MKELKLRKGTLIAHRGVHNKLIPENSMESFRKALSLNVPIEFDVHILKDGTVVVFHDDNLKRMFGIDKAIKNCTYEELSQYSYQNGEHIPTLMQVLSEIHGTVPIIIELKYDVKKYRLEKAVLTILKQYNGEYYIKSFWPFTMLWWKKHQKSAMRGFLIAVTNQNKLKVFLLEHLVSLLNIDFISYEKGYYNRPFIKKMSRKKIPIFYWTIKNEQELEKSLPYGYAFLTENILNDKKRFDK